MMDLDLQHKEGKKAQANKQALRKKASGETCF